MKRIRIALLGVLCLLSTTSLMALERMNWQVDGEQRVALVHMPVGASVQLPPLVFGFHGHGGRAQGAARKFRLHKLWPEAVVVYMQGVPTPGRLNDPQGKKTGWQHDPAAFDGRDLKFFDAVLETMMKQHDINPARIYATGHSNGGGFTYLLWLNRQDVFAAIAPSAAAHQALKDAEPVPVPVMHIAGRKDTLVKFEWQKAVMKRVCEINQCGREGVPWADGACQRFATSDRAPLLSCIHDGGHNYPVIAPELIVRFFQEHQRPPLLRAD